MDALLTAFGMVFDPSTIVVMLGASLFGLFVGAVPGLRRFRLLEAGDSALSFYTVESEELA